MAELGRTNFTGGALGDTITSTTEPIFTSTSGVVVYADGGSGRQGAQPTPTTFSQLWRAATPSGGMTISGLTEFRFGWKTRFVSSTATSTFYTIMVLRNGTTVVADVGLRNAAGARHAAFRTNFVYTGEAAGNTMNAGEVWSFEWYVNGTSGTCYVWEGEDTSGTPTYTWGPATMPSDPDNWFLGVGAATEVTATHSDLWMTDGPRLAQTSSGSVALGGSGSLSVSGSGSGTDFSGGVSLSGSGTLVGSAPIPGTLTLTSNTWASASEMVLAGKTSGAGTVKLELTPSAGGSTIVGSSASPDGANYFKAICSGLSANTEYNWVLFVDSVSRKTGIIKTLPATSGAQSFNFGWGSCFDTNTSGVFALMAARNPVFFGMLGDWGYQYITGGTNGNTSPTDQATIRTHREAVLAAATPQAFFTGRPISYTYSDCDGAGANSDSTTGGHANGTVQAAYRQQFAHPTLPLTNSGARSWVIGRVRFIHTDETAAASDKAATDNSSKTKLGTEQKIWFKAQIDAAVASGQVVVWLGDGPWIEPTSLSGNSWRAYATERTELGTYITASGVKIIRLHGDTHTLFYDNGTNNPWGGFPTASAAPMHTTGQTFGQTISGGKWPTSTTNSSRQYGIAEVVDSTSQISITLRGWSSTNAAPTEVERFTGVVNFDMSAYLNLSGSGTLSAGFTPRPAASASLSGSGALSFARSVGVSGSVGFSGSGALTNSSVVSVNNVLALSGFGTLNTQGGGASTGSVALIGSGTLGLTVVPRPAGAVSLVGAGTLGLTNQLSASATLNLSGSGTLARVGVFGSANAILFIGTGTLSNFAVPKPTASLALSGSGTLNFATAGSATGNINLTGSGTLTRSATSVVTSANVALNGLGTLSLSASTIYTGALSLSGTGSLSMSPTTTGHSRSLGLSGSGTLVSAVSGLNFARPLALSGSGTLSASASSTQPGSIALTGSGSLSTSSASLVPGNALLNGSGVLGFVTGFGVKQTLNLSGNGGLTTTGTLSISTPLSLGGSGTLVFTSQLIIDRAIVLNGSGQLSMGGQVKIINSVAFSGSGSLSINPTSTVVSSTLSLSGLGSLNSNNSLSSYTGAIMLSGSGILEVAKQLQRMWSMWDGTREITLIEEGVWNGSVVVPIPD